MLMAFMPADTKMPLVMQRDVRLLPPEKKLCSLPKRKKGGYFFKRLLHIGWQGL